MTHTEIKAALETLAIQIGGENGTIDADNRMTALWRMVECLCDIAQHDSDPLLQAMHAGLEAAIHAAETSGPLKIIDHGYDAHGSIDLGENDPLIAEYTKEADDACRKEAA